MIGTDTGLGAATVVRSDGRPGHVEVERPDGARAWARLAMAVAYAPAVGDELLVIGQEETFAIGVLRGRGAVSIDARSIRLNADERVEVVAPRVTLRAGRLEQIAQHVTQRARDAFVWVTRLLQLKSGRLRAVSETSAHVKAGRVHVKADADVSIDGRTVHLG